MEVAKSLMCAERSQLTKHSRPRCAPLGRTQRDVAYHWPEGRRLALKSETFMRTPDWVTACGEHIRLAEMSDDHILNVISYLALGDGVHGPMLRPGCSGFANSEWLQLCAVELTKRQRRR